MLNPQQQKAVNTLDGPVLIIAGAGSGKTKTLTHRVVNIIQKKDISPSQVLAVTFTNKAAKEMQERIKKIIPPSQYEPKWKLFPEYRPLIGTFHSICARILRQEITNLGRKSDFIILDSQDSHAVMRQILKDLMIDPKQFHYKAVLGKISDAKTRLLEPKVYAEYDNNFYQKKIATLYTEYQKRLEASNSLDFDDLIFLTIKLFQSNPQILEYFQDLWQYISVDEYQDTNFPQYLLIKLLAGKYNNLCVVGDSDQSIYGFRGANIQNILNFKQNYPETQIFKLEQNYRSTQIVLDAADNVIARNTNRIAKKMWTEKAGGEKISILEAMNEKEESVYITQELKQLQINGINLSDCVILYRTNAQSRVLEESLMRYALPYRVIGGVKFYARREIKDVLAYLRVIHNPLDEISLARIINTPPRQIGQKSWERIQLKATDLQQPISEILKHINMVEGLGPRAKTNLSSFWGKIQKMFKKSQQNCVNDLIKDILEVIGYKNYLTEDESEEGQVRLENVLELISVADKYNGLPPRESLASFLEEVALVADIDSYNEQENALTLMTLHTAKGLEFSHVFIAGCEENIFPHSRSSINPEELEEERRLMYVGMTRAMNKLYLSFARQRLIFGEYHHNTPSRFLEDIPKELVCWGNEPVKPAQIKKPILSYYTDEVFPDEFDQRNN